jgi:hypothetical protein
MVRCVLGDGVTDAGGGYAKGEVTELVLRVMKVAGAAVAGRNDSGVVLSG